MKSQLLASLLLINFYLDATLENNQQAASKKQKSSKRVLAKKVKPVSESIALTSSNLKTTLAGDLIIVLVGADWCKWCGLMAPVFEESNIVSHAIAIHATLSLGSYFGDPTSLVRQVEKNYEVKPVETIPTFLVFKKGKLVEQLSGSQTKEQLAELVEKHTDTSKKAIPIAEVSKQ